MKLILTAAALISLTGCGSSATPGDEPTAATSPTPTGPETIGVGGALKLVDSGLARYGDGQCAGDGGYDDIRGGAQVLIRDGDGTAIAKGSLEPGELEDAVTCVFPFMVPDVPVIEGLYSIEVSHRGEIMFSRQEAADIQLTIS
jgi:hypothetical protein